MCCQDVTAFVVSALTEKGVSALSYIDDFRVVVMDEMTAQHHFHLFCSNIEHLGLEEVVHKALPHASYTQGVPGHRSHTTRH